MHNSTMRNQCDIRHWSHQYNDGGLFYIALEDSNFAFTETELDTVIELWKAGRPVWDIAEELRRPDTEIAVLIIDLAERGKVKHRAGGVIGG